MQQNKPQVRVQYGHKLIRNLFLMLILNFRGFSANSAFFE